MMGLVEHKIAARMESHSNNVYDFQCSPCGRYAASGGMDINLRVWDVHKHTLLHNNRSHNDTINAVCWSTDGKYLVSGSFDSHAIVYDVDKGFEEILNVEPNGWRTVYGVAFSADCKSVIITADVNIRVFSLENGNEVGVMSGHTK